MGWFRMAAGVTMLLAWRLAATAAPVVESVTDSAGYGPRVAPGSLASIFGTNLASAEASAAGFPLPLNLSGTSVTMGGVAVHLLYVSAGQINFEVPSSVKSGAVALTVTGPGGTSASFSVRVASSAPAIFQYGTNHALAQNYAASGSALNGDSAPAPAGSVVIVYLTGIGAVNNAVADGAATPLSPTSTASATATATIGPLNAPVQFLGLTPEFAGLAQANIQVPTLPTGDYPLVVTVGGYVSASAVVSVSGSGTPYTSPVLLTGSAVFANSAASGVALYSNVAYVCGANRIAMVDVSDPTQPNMIGEFGDSVLNGNGVRCAINPAGSIPYLVEIVATSSGTESFAIWGLSNPESPNLLDVATTSYGNIVALSFSGNYAFAATSYTTYYTSSGAVAAQNGDLLAFDFTNPAKPLFIGLLEPQTANLKPYAAVVGQIYDYIASSTATGTSTSGEGVLDVVSVASPSSPAALYQVPVGQAAILTSFDISGNVLLAAGNTAGERNPGVPDLDFTGNLTLTTMDVTNFQAPAPIATFASNLQVNGTFHVAAFSGGVFAIVNNPPDTDDFGPASLMIIDARQPATIVPYPFRTQFGLSGIVSAGNGYLLAATALGLDVYQLQL